METRHDVIQRVKLGFPYRCWIKVFRRCFRVEMYRPSVEDSAKAIVTMPPRHNFSRIKYFYNGRHTIGCIFNMRFFPFDTQNCTFTFGSWCQDGSMLRYSLETDHVTTEYHQPSDTWTLVSFQMMAQESKFDCCQYPFVTVQAHYVIKRKSLYYAFNLILPTLVINILSSYALFASEGSPENRHDKLQIGLTTLLSYCILLLSVSDQLPKGSTSVPLLGNLPVFSHKPYHQAMSISGIFYIVIMLQNALELVVSVYLSFPHRRQRFILAYTRLISDRSWRFRKITSAKSAEANWEAGKNAIEVVSKEKEVTSMDADHPEFVCLTLGIISTAVITGIVFAVGCTA